MFVSPRPAWVFVADGPEERAFLDRVRQAGGHAQAASVSIYRVYDEVEPLDRLRP